MIFLFDSVIFGSTTQIKGFPFILHIPARATPKFPDDDSIITVSFLIIPSLYAFSIKYFAALSLILPNKLFPSILA